MATPWHIIVEGNHAIFYASRGGTPAKILPVLERFLDTFWQERDISGESADTPECLLAQVVVRFGFEICEDDFSNLKVGQQYYPEVEYLYHIAADRTLTVWTPTTVYSNNPNLGLQACDRWISQVCPAPP